MGLLDRAQCAVGLHDWSPWAPSDQCQQQRSCKRDGCEKRQEAVNHRWNDYDYLRDGSCEQERTCKRIRCAAEERQTAPHRWNSWAYLSEGNCAQARYCKRCPEKQQRANQHHWADMWRYASETSCVQVDFCRRCPQGRRERKPTQEDHRWAPPEKGQCGHVRKVCTRCAEASMGQDCDLCLYWRRKNIGR